MTFNLGVEVETEVGERYFPHPKHRGSPSSDSSVWSHSIAEEVGYFVEAWSCEWGARLAKLWGHRQAGGKLEPLGSNAHDEPLWFGKFLRHPTGSPWHGYPADYRRRTQDRPPFDVLTEWREMGILEKHHIAKIKKGQPCRF